MTASRSTADALLATLGPPDGGAVTEAFGDVHLDVAARRWLEALEGARDRLGLTFLDWLSGYDDTPRGLAVVAHLVSPETANRILLRTHVPVDDPTLPTATGLWPGAAWHERETWEMFGITFTGHPNLDPLLLHPDFEGRPLRKDFVLASRVVKEWPGVKDPSDVPGRVRRRPPVPPGVPPGWGPA